MTDSADSTPNDEPSTGKPSTDELRAEIERTRADLAKTVDALSEKLDVKARAGQKASDVKAEAKAKVSDAADKAKEVTPAPVANALGSVAEHAGPPAHRAASAAAPYRKQIAAGALAAVVVALFVRRRRSR